MEKIMNKLLKESIIYKGIECKLWKDNYGKYLTFKNSNDYGIAMTLGFKETSFGRVCLYVDNIIKCIQHGSDKLLHTINIDKEHFYYDKEDPLHGYGMSCTSDYFTLYEIDKDSYEGKYLPMNAKKICSHQKEIAVFHNIVCEIGEKIDEFHYSLIPQTGIIEELEKDKSFSEYHYWRAIALPINCYCGERFWFDDNIIPNDEMYEIKCPKCGTLLKRKKV